MGETFTMPIQNRGRGPELAGPFIWEPTKEDRQWADNNHGQTLERLAERGGMAWSEMAFIILHRRYDRSSRVHTDQAYAKAVCRDVLIMRERQAGPSTPSHRQGGETT